MTRHEHLAPLRATLAKMEIALGAVADPMAWFDSEGLLEWCNPAFEQLVGRQRIDLLGAHVTAVLPLEHEGAPLRAGSHPVVMSIEAAAPLQVETSFRSSRGLLTLQLWATRIVPERKLEHAAWVVVIHDLTQERQAEEERRRLWEERMARRLAEERVRSRDEFMMIANHEMKTPLSAMLLQLELLRRRSSGRPAEIVTRLDRQLRRLTVLMDTLLDVSRMASGRLELRREEVDLARIARDTVDGEREVLATAGSTAVVQAPRPVVGSWDPTRMEQVIANLLTNAIRYGGGGRIELEVTSRDGLGVLQVSDHGIGIARDDQQRIFERFERAASPDRYGGLGVGLFVCREIVLAHGGTIRVESEPGEGATFIVELPRTATTSDS